MPVYNRSAMVGKSIESVINQDYSEWELIIVDDGSTDDTAEVVRKYGKQDARVKYFYQENQERCVARNNGISFAHGTYICFLDSDDFYHPQHLSTLKRSIHGQQYPMALFFTDCVIHSMGVDYQTENLTFNTDNPIDYFLFYSVIPSRVCIHLSIFEKFNFLPHIVIGEDTILWTRIATSFPIFHINEPTVHYHLHDSNSVNLKKNVFLDRLHGIEYLLTLPEMRGKVSLSTIKRVKSECYFGIARHHELHKRFFKMLTAIIFSIYYEPGGARVKKKIYMLYDFFK